MIVELKTREEVYLPPGSEDDMRIRSACIWTIRCGDLSWKREWVYDVHPYIPMRLVSSSLGWTKWRWRHKRHQFKPW